MYWTLHQFNVHWSVGYDDGGDVGRQPIASVGGVLMNSRGSDATFPFGLLLRMLCSWLADVLISPSVVADRPLPRTAFYPAGGGVLTSYLSDSASLPPSAARM